MKIFAHRGSKGTHPENTLAAIEEAVKIGSDGIEIDIHLSKDRELIVIHDETLNRTTDKKGAIHQLNLTEIKQADAGSWFSTEFFSEPIPTLNEVCDLLNRLNYRGVLNIELKTDIYSYDGIETIVNELMNGQSQQFTFIYSSFNLATLERLHQIDKKTDKAWIMEGRQSELQQARATEFINAIHPHYFAVTHNKTHIEACGQLVRPWTVNKQRTMKRLLMEKIEGFHTDFPKEAIHLRNSVLSIN
ncbi:glycerophosphodiester phosphodiesterase family protein [Vagococcus vulneris]|uniref:GP-PDE domain-containing protein n=1 Tax=Vagococcus vulneris TaxID=1977869 RepID=A0A429ZWM5_9ENTE|nr:glycerophosphodiester phosphodiesterase family protein [Vagococcus vulneris]RST98209.1 hypothetical protein CBF37_08550 [Vagococcus vulneris]